VTVAQALGAWVAGLRDEDVPLHVAATVRRQLLDGTGTALAAARLGAARPAVAVAAGLGGPPEATPLSGGPAIGAPAAAFADGVLVHALDFDDTHPGALVHPTATVLPAAFAVGEQVGATGADVLTAAVAGYEVVCRLGAGAPHGFHAQGVHATGACGPFAAAAVAARLLGLDAQTTAAALGIAGSSAAGLLEFLATGAATKQLHPGTASLTGILAARLAASGADGPPAVVEGERGLYAALTARPADAASVVDGLGERFALEGVAVKAYPCCQLMHAALDAGRALADRVGDPAGVEAILAEVHPDSAAIVGEPIAAKAAPRSVYDAKFSLPWSLAALLLDGDVTVETYSADALARADVARLAARVRTVRGPAGGAAAGAPARLTATTAAGTVEAAVPCSAGGPERPLSDADLRAKFLANAGADRDAADELAGALLGLERLDGVHRLRALASRLATGALA